MQRTTWSHLPFDCISRRWIRKKIRLGGDFAEVKKGIEPIIDSIDHKLLNDIEGLQNPTCEMIAIWLWNKIKNELPLLTKIELSENATSGVIYEGI